MVEKARSFKDHRAVELIISSSDPSTHKRVGRGVRNFDTTVWDREKQNAVISGNFFKFTQNPAMKHLAEASPLDTVWGIGPRADDPHAKDPHKWREKCFLGEALSAVRQGIRGSKTESPHPAFPRRFRSPPEILEFTKFRPLSSRDWEPWLALTKTILRSIFWVHPLIYARRL